MKRLLLCGLAAAVGLTMVVDTSDAGLFRRRRANNCQTCNACQMQTGWQSQQQFDQYDPNMNAPPPAPNAPNSQAFNNQGGPQGNTTFYRGDPNAPQPQTAPNAPRANANVQGQAEITTDQNGQLDARGNAGAGVAAPQRND